MRYRSKPSCSLRRQSLLLGAIILVPLGCFLLSIASWQFLGWLTGADQPEHMRYRPTPRPEWQTLERFEQLLQTGQSKQAWALLSPATKRLISKEQFATAASDPRHLALLFHDAPIPTPSTGEAMLLYNDWNGWTVAYTLTHDLKINNFTVIIPPHYPQPRPLP